MIEDNLLYRDLTYKIIGIAYEVDNQLGYGQREKIIENSFARGFDNERIKYMRQVPFAIIFQGKKVGQCFFDFLVENKIIVELKRGSKYSKKEFDQVLAYLQASGIKLGLLICFTPQGVKYYRVLNPDNLKEKCELAETPSTLINYKKYR